MSYGERPFGMREIVIRDEAGSNPVALPIAILMAVSERIERVEFIAEAALVGVEATVQALDWELEAGGISLAAWSRLTGRSVAETGNAPNRNNTMIVAAGNLPWLVIYGRSVGDGTDDIYIKLHKAKVTSIEGTLRQREFFVTSCAGVAIPDADGEIYTIVQRESSVALV